MKKGRAGLRGVAQVTKNLNKQITSSKVASMKGLILASAFIRKDMEMTPPLIPVDQGNLRASWFATPGRSLGKPYVQIGFTASYAVIVHEMIGKNINWSRPGSGAKFLESALKRNKVTILKIIAERKFFTSSASGRSKKVKGKLK